MKTHFLNRWFRPENIVQISIAIIALLILHNFVVALFSKRVVREQTEFAADQREILNRVEQIGTNVNLVDLGFRGYYLVPKENFKEPLEIARRQHRENLDSLTVYLSRLQYPHLDSLQIVDRWIREYMDLADEGLALIDQGSPEEAVALFANDPGYTLWSKYSKIQASIREYVNEMADISTLKGKRVTQYAFIAQLLLVFAGCLTLGFVVYKLRRNETEIQGLFDRIKESDRTYVYHSGEENEKEDNERVIERMIGNLKHASEYIQKISKGNLDIEWKGMSGKNSKLNNTTLAGELINMKEQMKRVKEDEGNRMWVSEGISTFSEIIRKNQDNLQEMSDRLLAKIVKYLEANQGGLFFLQDEEGQASFLELMSCYAYDKKKFTEKRVDLDKGVLGQAFREGSMVVLKEIPEEYIHITSGLGEATPNHLVLVPLKFNEHVVGVLELASFRPFTPIHLELLQKISEIVASAVINSRNSEKMQELLQTATQTAEEMRAQEEEMRQNMEELQATQEELARKESELLARIRELEEESTQTREVTK